MRENMKPVQTESTQAINNIQDQLTIWDRIIWRKVRIYSWPDIQANELK